MSGLTPEQAAYEDRIDELCALLAEILATFSGDSRAAASMVSQHCLAVWRERAGIEPLR